MSGSTGVKKEVIDTEVTRYYNDRRYLKNKRSDDDDRFVPRIAPEAVCQWTGKGLPSTQRFSDRSSPSDRQGPTTTQLGRHGKGPRSEGGC